MPTERELLAEMAPTGREAEPGPKDFGIVVPGHAINHIEMEILERMMLELQGLVPAIFIDPETGDLDVIAGQKEPWAKYFDGRIPAPWEAAELTAELHALVESKYIERIEIARSLGPNGTQRQYLDACKKEGLNP